MEGSDHNFSDLEWQEKIVHLHNTHLFFKPPTKLSHTHTDRQADRQTDRQTDRHTHSHTQLLVYQLHAPIILKAHNRFKQTAQTHACTHTHTHTQMLLLRI